MPRPLTDGWTLLDTAPGAAAAPADLPDAPGRPAPVPGTVAQALDLPLDGPPDIEGRDWWYRAAVEVPAEGAWRLRLAGLATLCEVWVDDDKVLETANMHRSHAVDLPAGPHRLALCFRSLTAALAGRRPRPRWKTALVDEQKLRFVRTSLLGRIPGWTPRLPAVGPWRPVTLARVPRVQVTRLLPGVSDGVATLSVRAEVSGARAAALRLGDRVHPLQVEPEGVSGDLRLPGVGLWWPHTHGTPHLHEATLLVDEEAIPLGRLGFRSLALDRSDDRVQLRVNGVPVFCRGACWTVADVRSLDGAPGAAAATLARARDAGLNMVRVGGTMTWASDALLEACDAMGVLLWQDLMFANFDLPLSEPGFRREVEAELDDNLARLQPHAAVAALCGGSEIAQQAAMMGLPEAEWSHPAFTTWLPARCAATLPAVPWFPHTPWGGALPFHTGQGLSHYYGVGAYQRPLADARRAAVRFSPECLAFANVPEEEALALLPDKAVPPPHHPAWKAGVPRDNGAGWDFEDVRDHYLRALFGVDPASLRYPDPARYRALSRVVSGEVMLRTFAEWRRPRSGCGGALVWFLRDLRPGAGWGVLDDQGRPKAALRYLARAWARRAVLMTDEGLDGLALHVHNEHPEALSATVELVLLRSGRPAGPPARAPVALAPFAACTLSADALLGHFADLTHAYRFGPPKHDVVLARLRGEDDAVLHEDMLFPAGHALPVLADAGLQARAEADGEDVVLHLETAVFLQAVHVQAAGFDPEDDHFHLAPGAPRAVRLRRQPGPTRGFKAWVGALNLDGFLTVRA